MGTFMGKWACLANTEAVEEIYLHAYLDLCLWR